MHSVKPDTFLVGAPKAGTSLLAALLNNHPQITTGRIKEPNYFNTDLDLPRPKSEAEYLALYGDNPARVVTADCSVQYLHSKVAAAKIAAFRPGAKILMVLREPVEAMYSWHGQMLYTSNEPLIDFAAALEAEADRKQGRRLPPAGSGRTCPQMLFYRDLMRYHEQIARYLEYFDRDQMLILRFEDLTNRTREVYRRTMNFLGVDPSFEPLINPINTSKVRKYRGAHVLMKRLLAQPARVLPLILRKRLIAAIDSASSRNQKRAEMDPQVKARMRRECVVDIKALETLLDEDFSDWMRPEAVAPRSQV